MRPVRSPSVRLRWSATDEGVRTFHFGLAERRDMHADAIDPQAKEAIERQERIPMPHSRRALPFLRLPTRVTM